jgi:hypothetical protein
MTGTLHGAETVREFQLSSAHEKDLFPEALTKAGTTLLNRTTLCLLTIHDDTRNPVTSLKHEEEDDEEERSESGWG